MLSARRVRTAPPIQDAVLQEYFDYTGKTSVVD